jgi:4-hydroxy-3-polyprenylbenzoate decarboxylase
LGFGQLSLAKYVFITNKEDNPELSCNDIENYFVHFLERVDWKRDVHFQTNTTIDTLDYSGNAINSGSKVVMAAVGDKKRSLCDSCLLDNAKLVQLGIIAINFNEFKDYEAAQKEIAIYAEQIKNKNLDGIMLILLVDDVDFVAANLNNFLWVTFTRSNPANDIYGVNEFIKNKHWGCDGPLIIDARIKPHHAPALEKDEAVEKRVDELESKGVLRNT